MTTPRNDASRRNSRCAFTLVELLIVIGIVGILAGLLLPAILYARAMARKTTCMNNLRQVGLAMQMFSNDHNGRFPETSHTAGVPDQGWIYTLAPYLENVDEIRLCPDDLQRDERLRLKQTTYVMNAYITSETTGGVTKLHRLKATTRTITLFELADHRLATTYADHVHSFNWFRQSNINKKTVYKEITNEIATKRHLGAAHYLFADGHVESIPDATIRDWALEPRKFCLPE